MIAPIQTDYKGYRFRSDKLPTEPKNKTSGRADHTGERFGRLVAIECLGMAEGGYRWWGCICDCGTKVAVRSRELLRCRTRSCGCFQRENRAHYGGMAGGNKLPHGHAARNELLRSYQRSARRRGITWQLCAEEFIEIVSSPCAYCGISPDGVHMPHAGINGGFVYSGIDRIDNAIGYEPGNVVPCCWNCNRSKSTLGLDMFLQWCSRITENAAARVQRFDTGKQEAENGN